jgi:hypothetical protein
MKKLILIFLLLVAVTLFGQYKETGIQTTSVKDGIKNNSQNNLFGFLNMNDFTMRHSFSMQYSSFGNHGMALGVYTNSMFYRLMDNMDVQLDVSLVHSPYSTFGEAFQKDISGLYISNAAINYRPWKDVSIHLQYRTMPYGYGYYRPFNGMYSPFTNPGFNTSTHSNNEEY